MEVKGHHIQSQNPSCKHNPPLLWSIGSAVEQIKCVCCFQGSQRPWGPGGGVLKHECGLKNATHSSSNRKSLRRASVRCFYSRPGERAESRPDGGADQPVNSPPGWHKSSTHDLLSSSASPSASSHLSEKTLSCSWGLTQIWSVHS